MANRNHTNKENSAAMKSLKNTITSSFKVKKCLFTANSPLNEPCSPMETNISPGGPMDDSPFALYQIRKRKTCCQSSMLQMMAINGATPLKRDFIPGTPEAKQEEPMAVTPENCKCIKQAVHKSIAESNLTGNFSKTLNLPIISGSHPDLRTISPQTVADLLNGPQTHQYIIMDCRYPYEYEGGHIRSAVNMYFKVDVEVTFFDPVVTNERKELNKILIMYCEFSSQRAPSMLRYLRSLDRDKNEEHYPFLFYPELYLIEGGYKAFYANFKELCEPEDYITMLDKGCVKERDFYRSKCKSWNVKSKRWKRTRSNLKFESPQTVAKE